MSDKRTWFTCNGLGKELCVAAYKPLGADDIADSYVNLANPGTYDCTNPGATPAWSAAAGWICSANSYILTGANDASALSLKYGMSVLIRYSAWNMVNWNESLLGGTNSYAYLYQLSANGKGSLFASSGWQAGGSQLVGSRSTSGVVIITKNSIYFDGTFLATFLGGGDAEARETMKCVIGAFGVWGYPITYADPAAVNIQAVAVYDANIDPFVSILTTQAQNLT